MDKLEKVEEKLNKVETRIKDENTIATNVINKLIKIIIFQFILFFVVNTIWIIGTFWYNSLPVEETEIIQDADTVGESSPIHQQVGE